MSNPKISIVVPFHWMGNWQFFLQRCLESIEAQSYKNYEVILMKVGSMPVTTNAVIKSATGDYIKILYMDDYFAHPFALQKMVELMERTGKEWLISGASTNPKPYWTDDIERGNNHLGSPSVLMMKTSKAKLFDERLSWLLDCDLYKRLYQAYGKPLIVEEILINIGEHKGQMTHILTDEEKLAEHEYLNKKYNV